MKTNGVLGAQFPVTHGNLEHGPIEVDLTDGDGHGVLIATDQVTVQARYNASEPTADIPNQQFNIEMKILYRFKQVGVLEYVGIVQSQQ